MKKIWLVGSGCILMAGFLWACTTKNMEDQKVRSEASRNLGEAYMRQGRIRPALKELKKAEQLYSADHILQDDLGLAYFYLEEQDRAILHFKKALELKNDYTPARNNLGNAYAANQQWDKAIEQYKIVLSDLVYATPHFPLSNLGLVYFELQEYEIAEQYYFKALKLQPNFSRALYGLGKTYMAMGRAPEAIVKLERAVKSSPESATVHLELANAYAMNREYQKAYNAYHKVVRLNPGTPQADKALSEAEKIKYLF